MFLLYIRLLFLLKHLHFTQKRQRDGQKGGSVFLNDFLIKRVSVELLFIHKKERWEARKAASPK